MKKLIKSLFPICIAACMLLSCRTQKDVPSGNNKAHYNIELIERRQWPMPDTALIIAEYPSYEFPEDTLHIHRIKTNTKDLRFPRFRMNHPHFYSSEALLAYYCSHYIKYHFVAREQGIEGRVIVRFIVTDMGMVDSVSTYKGCDATCDRAVRTAFEKVPVKRVPGDYMLSENGDWRTIKATDEIPIEEDGIWKWEPAIRNGKAVSTIVYLPVIFKLIYK